MNHEYFIQHCLSLANQGRGYIGNGALVGSCLVRDNTIIAEGYHAKFGEFHAERNLLSITLKSDTSTSLSVTGDDVLYVNLEPCCHYGKTPPCTDIIIESGVKTVVFGMYDPDPRVAGKGVEKLRKAGIQVVGPIEQEICRRFNKGYVSMREKNRPYITLKRAQMPDGTIARVDGSPLKITSAEQDSWSHSKLRATHDAILVGVGTVVADDPRLTIRLQYEECRMRNVEWSPLRIVLDPHLRIPLDSTIITDEIAQSTIVICDTKINIQHSSFNILLNRGVKIFQVSMSSSGFNLHELLQKLSTPKNDYIGITSILVEGGQKTWGMFKKAGLYDEEVVLVGALEKNK